MISCSHKNTHNVPHRAVLDRMSTATKNRLVVSTTPGSGEPGFTSGGTMLLTTDGWRYRIAAENGESVDLYTDEYRGRSPAAGDLVISEIHRFPSVYWGRVHRGLQPLRITAQPARSRSQREERPVHGGGAVPSAPAPTTHPVGARGRVAQRRSSIRTLLARARRDPAQRCRRRAPPAQLAHARLTELLAWFPGRAAEVRGAHRRREADRRVQLQDRDTSLRQAERLRHAGCRELQRGAAQRAAARRH